MQFQAFFCCSQKNFLKNGILEISEYLGSKILKNIIGILFVLYFIFTSSLLLETLCKCLQMIYFPMTNIVFIIALFCISAGAICFLKNSGIFKAVTIFAPILFFIILLIFVGNCENFDFYNIYPILGNGIDSTFISGMSNLFAFSGFSYIFFILPKLKNQKNLSKILLISIIISSIFLILCVADLLLLFGENISNSELFPMYISVRCIEFGTFFQRMDSVFLFFCIISFTCSLSLSSYIIIDILKNITNSSDDKPFIFPTFLCIFGFSIFWNSFKFIDYFENYLSKILFIIFSIILPIIIFLLANLKKRLTKSI